MTSPWTYQSLVADALVRVPEISCEDAHRRPAPRAVFLDLREPDELSDGTLPGAIALPRGLLEKHIHDHVADPSTPLYLFCATGKRSALAGDVLLKMGYSRVFNLQGGIESWRALGLPVEGGPSAAKLPADRLSWSEVRARFPIVHRRVPVVGGGERALVYLDNAATTHAPLPVLQAHTEFMASDYSTVHRATHRLARAATERFEAAYGVIARFIGAELEHGCLVFTQNTTQAIDLCSQVMRAQRGVVVTTELDHHSNDLPHRAQGPVLRARVDAQGELDLGHVEQLLAQNEVKLLCVSAASNVTGVMPPLATLARLAHQHGARILVDAAQALAHLELDVKPVDHPEHLDFLACSGHKAYAPFGVGFLYGPRKLFDEAAPYLPGGGTTFDVTATAVDFMPAPDRHQGGTPNVGGVVALSSALQFIEAIGRPAVRAHEVGLTQRALDGLRALTGVTVYGRADATTRLGVISFNVEGVSPLLTAAVLSEEGAIAVRHGRFCAHPYVARLLGSTDQTVLRAGMVRASFGLFNDQSDVQRLLEFVERVTQRKWVGRYRTRGHTISATFPGQCADEWMEDSTGSADDPD